MREPEIQRPRHVHADPALPIIMPMGTAALEHDFGRPPFPIITWVFLATPTNTEATRFLVSPRRVDAHPAVPEGPLAAIPVREHQAPTVRAPAPLEDLSEDDAAQRGGGEVYGSFAPLIATKHISR